MVLTDSLCFDIFLVQDASKSTQPGENDLTKNKASHTAFVDPPEILNNINPKDMIDTLEKGYKEKQKKKKP